MNSEGKCRGGVGACEVGGYRVALSREVRFELVSRDSLVARGKIPRQGEKNSALGSWGSLNE